MKRWFQLGLVAVILGMTGCVTTPSLSVNVQRMSQDWPSGSVAVLASSNESQWAVEQALGERQWRVDGTSPYRLTVYENERAMVRTLDDPFCGPYGAYGYGPYPRAYYRGGWGGWYGAGPYGWNGWGCAPPRVQSYNVREMTWVLTRQGDDRTLWSATARETSPRGPALELARKLAAGLDLAPTR